MVYWIGSAFAGVRFRALNHGRALKHDPSQTDEDLTAVSVNKMENMTSVAETIFFFSSNTKYTQTHTLTLSSFSLHFSVILSPSWVVVTSVVHQSLKVDFFFFPFTLMFFFFFFFFCQTAIVTYWASKKWKIFMQACNTCNEVLAWPSVWLIL